MWQVTVRRALVGFLAIGVLGVAVVSAHMALQRSAPEEDATLAESPDEIQLWFTQEPDPAVSQVSLAREGGSVEIGETQIGEDRSLLVELPDLEPGRYTVSWRSAGDDGHIQRGEFSFSIQTAD